MVTTRRRAHAEQTGGAVAGVYRALLAEAGVPPHRDDGPPLKKLKRPGQPSSPAPEEDDSDDSDDDLAFEDIAIPAPVVQTAELDSDSDDDESSDDDQESSTQEQSQSSVQPLPAALQDAEPPQTLELNLSAHDRAVAMLRETYAGGRRKTKTPRTRRRALTRTERAQRVAVHKMHVLCLLAHAARRNRWCSAMDVQDVLRPILPAKVRSLLNPRRSLSQFGRTESLKTGLQQAMALFRARFAITQRGLRRAQWAESAEQLHAFGLPPDAETVLDKTDFLAAARTLEGSRDVGAQLFCALLRSVGVETRLVCSLQALPLGPTTTTTTTTTTPTTTGRSRAADSPCPVYWTEVLDVAHQAWQPVDALVTASLWRPHKLEPVAADRANQLAYAIAFDADGHAKDVTRRYARAFSAKTRRARVDGLADTHSVVAAAARAAALDTDSHTPNNAKTDPGEPLSGARWLRRALRPMRASATDLDQIEDRELAAAAAREPLPRSVADFHGHPVYALARHLRRHEVLVPGATSVGTVAAGATAPLERIYRRRDVRVAYNADRWYRLGRVVRPGEIPAKWMPRPAVRGIANDPDDDHPRRGLAPPVVLGSASNEPDNNDDDDDDDDLFADKLVQHPLNGVPLFTPEQTELYRAPPVVHGRVPKNRFGNIDVYVPSMVPAGGAYVDDADAVRAAFVLGVDYAPALTGFQFEGRRGTAVLRGAVVAAEHEAAVRVVLDGLHDLHAQQAAEQRTRAALRRWAQFLRGLQIRARIRAAAVERGELDLSEGDEAEADEADADEADADVADEQAESDEAVEAEALEAAESDTTLEFDMGSDSDGGGGFVAE